VAPRIDFVVAGAGVAGLTAALGLARRGFRIKVVERARSIGGLAGAETFRGLPCDLGSHRLHAEALRSPTLREVHAAHPFLRRPRRGVLLLGDRKVSYPPSVVAILRALGPRVAVSFARSALGRHSPFHHWDRERTLRSGQSDSGFEDFVVARTGRAAYSAFYAPYAEKVWGVDPSELSQTVAKRRVSTSSPLQMLRKVRTRADAASTFLYPAEGISTIVRYLSERLTDLGVEVELGAPLDLTESGAPVLFSGRLVDLVPTTLEHRGVYLVYVALPVDRASTSETYYCPDKRAWFGRVSELSNYSPSLKRAGETVLCVEIPEGRWGKGADFASGARFQELHAQLQRCGIAPRGVSPIEVRQRFVPDVYPVYRRGWMAEWEAAMRRVVALGRVFPFGRQGLFLHCNIDHAIDIAEELVDHVAAGGDPHGWVSHARGFLELRVRD
jgi:protoporphyrinogen oxidase